MNYTPRYTYWLYKANAKLNDLPTELSALIQQYETSFALWQEAKEMEQQSFLKIVEQADAFISAKIYTLYESRINPQSENDRLKELMSKADDLDF